MVVIMLMEFFGGLRGEYVTLLSLKEISKLWNETRRNPTPCIVLTLRGVFRGELGDRWRIITIDEDMDSNILVRKWF